MGKQDLSLDNLIILQHKNTIENIHNQFNVDSCGIRENIQTE